MHSCAVEPIALKPVGRLKFTPGANGWMLSDAVMSSGTPGYHEGGIPMSRQTSIAERILEEVGSSPRCEFEALMRSCPEFSWREVLLEVARLSRTGQVRITRGTGILTRTYLKIA